MNVVEIRGGRPSGIGRAELLRKLRDAEATIATLTDHNRQLRQTIERANASAQLLVARIAVSNGGSIVLDPKLDVDGQTLMQGKTADGKIVFTVEPSTPRLVLPPGLESSP